jgi:hypothetical protein
MTCAGASSLLLARDAIAERLEPQELQKLNRAIRDGNGWLMGSWTPTRSYYGMYSLEKVADIGGIRVFAGHDWYREVSSELVRRQRGDGSWGKGRGPGEDDSRVTTSFALLVLARASRLINPVIYTGQSGPSSADDQTWVFVPRLGKHVHYPTLLRTIRHRPSHRIAKLLVDIVENQPLQWRGDLVPGILLAKKKVESASVRRALDDALREITGVPDGDPERCSEWHERWQSVEGLAQKKDKQSIDQLLEIYSGAGGSLLLKRRVADAFLRNRIRRGIPRIFHDLDDDDVEVRRWAYQTLQSFYVDPVPPFDPEGSSDRRFAETETIRKWILTTERAVRADR